MKKFMVRWTADGYCVEFNYIVVSETLDNAKKLWDEYVNANSNIRHSWDEAVKAVKRHYGGYIAWQDIGETNESESCYEMEIVNTYYGSDHLRD